ncbi:hypothetical protein DNTS_029422, partial [Danionella cerebrum]
MLFFYIIAKLRFSMHEGSANTHSRTMAADAKLQKCMRRARGLQQRMQQEQEQQQEPSRPQGPTSEQPGQVQVLLTDNQEEIWKTNQDSALGPLSPEKIKPPSSYKISSSRSQPSRSPHPASSHAQPKELHWSEQNDGEWGGIRLSDVLQASGIRVMPIRKHLAISLPSLPLWGVLGEDEDNHHPQTSISQPPNTSLVQGFEDNSKEILCSRSSSSTPALAEEKGTLPLRAPIWQPLGGSSQPKLNKLNSSGSARHWSSWSLDHPDSAVVPFDTTPHQNQQTASSLSQHTSGRNLALHSPMSTRKKNISHHLNLKRMELESLDPEDQELSELDSLYQASLQAGPVLPPARKLLTGVGRSRTPTAELERTAYGPPGCYSPVKCMNLPLSVAHQELPSGEEDQYDADHLRRIARSLSGTIIGRRQNRLAVSRSF